MTDAEIFKRNVKRICKQKHMKMGCVDLEAGYNENYLHYLVGKHVEPSDEAVRCYAKALGVKPERLTEGFYDN